LIIPSWESKTILIGSLKLGTSFIISCFPQEENFIPLKISDIIDSGISYSWILLFAWRENIIFTILFPQMLVQRKTLAYHFWPDGFNSINPAAQRK
jgi:hypothetical protein